MTRQEENQVHKNSIKQQITKQAGEAVNETFRGVLSFTPPPKLFQMFFLGGSYRQKTLATEH